MMLKDLIGIKPYPSFKFSFIHSFLFGSSSFCFVSLEHGDFNFPVLKIFKVYLLTEPT